MSSTVYVMRNSTDDYRGRHRRSWFRRRKPLYVALGVLLAATAVGCGVGATSDDTDPAPAATTQAAAKGSTAAKGAPPKVAAPAKIRDGQWLVGKGVAAGTYVTPGAKEGVIQLCAWTVKASDDTDAHTLAFGTSGETTEQGRVKLKAGQIFHTKGCQDWVKQ